MRIWRVSALVAIAAVACARGDVEVSTSPTPPAATPTPGADLVDPEQIATYEWQIDARFRDESGIVVARLVGGYDRDRGVGVMEVELRLTGDPGDIDEVPPTRPLRLAYLPDGLAASGLDPFWTSYVPEDGGPFDPEAWYRADEAISLPPAADLVEPMIEGVAALFATLGVASPDLLDAGADVVGGAEVQVQTARLDAESVSDAGGEAPESLAALVATTEAEQLIATVWVDGAGVVRRLVVMPADTREGDGRVEVELTGFDVAISLPDPATIEELVPG